MLSISVVVGLYFIFEYDVWTVCDKCMDLPLLMQLSLSIEHAVQPHISTRNVCVCLQTRIVIL